MISKIVVPDLGATGGDVSLQRWLVEPGDKVQAGQPLFLLETDKATVEVESFRDGLVHSLLVDAGSSVSIGSVVALVADSMNESADSAARESLPQPTPAPELVPRKVPGISLPIVDETPDRILASPAARRLAKQEKINLHVVVGSGRQGQILRRDIERVLALELEPQPHDPERPPLSPLRQSIAQRTLLSKTQIPHFYAAVTVDMAKAIKLKKDLDTLADEKGQPAPSVTDLCLRAAALTLIEYPILNASFGERKVIYHEEINIGLVIGLPGGGLQGGDHQGKGLRGGGMLVPVVHDADKINLLELAALTRNLRERAQSGVLSAVELSGGTFTLSNLGVYGLDSFTAIINPPQAGILALGAIRERPSVYQYVIAVRPVMKATLSADHRLVDGVSAAQFLTALKEKLENPVRLLSEGSEGHE